VRNALVRVLKAGGRFCHDSYQTRGLPVLPSPHYPPPGLSQKGVDMEIGVDTPSTLY
jgi:hypothetical protein